MNTTPRYIEYLPIVALCICLFGSYPVGTGLLLITLFVSIIFYNSKLTFKFEDLSLFSYFIVASLVYNSLNNELTNYAEIVFFPILIYLSVGTIKTDGLKALKLLLFFVIVYSVATFFRDVDGNFTLSITDNIYMHQRMVNESSKDSSNDFFINATLVAIWPVTAFIISLCLYNSSKKKLYIYIAAGAFLMVFLTNTRNALGCVIIIALINSIQYKQKTILRLIIFSIPIILIIIFALGNLYQSQMERFNDLTQGSSSYGLGDRLYFWNYTIELIETNIWGYGHDYVFKHIDRSTHNEYLGQSVSVGLIAAIFYFFFIMYSVFKRFSNIRKRYNSTWNEVAFYLLIVYLINGVTEQVSFGNRVWVALLFTALGLSKTQNRVDFRFVNILAVEQNRSLVKE